MKETFFMTMRFIVFDGVFARLETCVGFHLWVCVCVHLCLWEGRRKVRVRECSMQGPTEAKLKRRDCLKEVKLQTACCRSTPSWEASFRWPCHLHARQSSCRVDTGLGRLEWSKRSRQHMTCCLSQPWATITKTTACVA